MNIQKILTSLLLLGAINTQHADAAQINGLIIDAFDARASEDEMCALIARSPNINSSDRDGNLPLVYASGERDYNAMKAMLEAGADVNLPDKRGRTPLKQLLFRYEGLNERPQLQLLLDYGADWSDIHYGTLRPGLQKFFKNYAKKKSEQQQKNDREEADERHISQLDLPPFQRISQIQLQKVKDGAHALREEWVQLKTDTVELHQQTTSNIDATKEQVREASARLMHALGVTDIDATKEQVREASARLMHALGVTEQERDSKQLQLDKAQREIDRLSGILSSGSQSPSITYNVNHDNSQNYNNQDNKQCCSNIWCKLLCCFRCCKRCEQPCRESKFNGCSLCSV